MNKWNQHFIVGIILLLYPLVPHAQNSRCNFNDFTQSGSEHIINEIKQPFHVRKIEGMIKSETGEWPEGVHVLFELRRQEKDSKLIKINADKNGAFKLDSIKKGKYCFKATATGWQSVVGTIIVSPNSDPKSRITFQMLLGV